MADDDRETSAGPKTGSPTGEPPTGEPTTGEPTAGAPEERAKKERVLHTRVPAVLEQELKRLATNLKMPVSNLVRAILEDALDAVDAVGQRAEGELHGIAERLRIQRDALRNTAVAKPASEPAAARAPRSEGRAPSPAPAADATATRCPPSSELLEGVIGFQSLVLIADATCSVCGKALPKGTKACRGVREEPGPRVLLGPECGLLPSSSEEDER